MCASELPSQKSWDCWDFLVQARVIYSNPPIKQAKNESYRGWHFKCVVLVHGLVD